MTHYGDGAGEPGVPDAPFKSDWHELVIKRMLRHAAENDYDRLAWTTGDQQAARYDLSKQIDSLDWMKNDNGTYSIAANKGGEEVFRKMDSTQADLQTMLARTLPRKSRTVKARITECRELTRWEPSKVLTSKSAAIGRKHCTIGRSRTS